MPAGVRGARGLGLKGVKQTVGSAKKYLSPVICMWQWLSGRGALVGRGRYFKSFPFLLSASILFCSLAHKNLTGMKNKGSPIELMLAAVLLTAPNMGMLQPQLFLQPLSSQQQPQKSPHLLQYLEQTKCRRQFVPLKLPTRGLCLCDFGLSCLKCIFLYGKFNTKCWNPTADEGRAVG